MLKRWGGRAVRGLLLVVMASAALTACRHESHEPGDPAAVSRAFILALWTADTKRIDALSCSFTEWPAIGDPTIQIDAEHMGFETVSKTDDQVVLAMTGVVTFRTAGGKVEVRDFDAENQTVFTLQDENGWKVCDIQ